MCAETSKPPATHISPMTIDQPKRNPQAEAFHGAAIKMREHRYFRTENLEGQLDTLIALSEVATELSFHLDRLRILEPAALLAYRQASRLPVPAFVEMSAEVLLTFSLAAAAQNLRTLREL